MLIIVRKGHTAFFNVSSHFWMSEANGYHWVIPSLNEDIREHNHCFMRVLHLLNKAAENVENWLSCVRVKSFPLCTMKRLLSSSKIQLYFTFNFFNLKKQQQIKRHTLNRILSQRLVTDTFEPIKNDKSKRTRVSVSTEYHLYTIFNHMVHKNTHHAV